MSKEAVARARVVSVGKQWRIVDRTGPNGGYLRLERSGQRVADFFPFAAGVDEQWVRAQAQIIERTMNGEIDGSG